MLCPHLSRGMLQSTSTNSAMCTWHYPLRKSESKPRIIVSLLAWMYGTTQRRSLWHLEARPMLQLASLQDGQDEEYEHLLASDELRHPIIASLRLQIQCKPQKHEPETTSTEPSQTQSDNVLSGVVVEAEPCTSTDIPNESRASNKGAACRLFAGE